MSKQNKYISSLYKYSVMEVIIPNKVNFEIIYTKTLPKKRTTNEICQKNNFYECD